MGQAAAVNGTRRHCRKAHFYLRKKNVNWGGSVGKWKNFNAAKFKAQVAYRKDFDTHYHIH